MMLYIILYSIFIYPFVCSSSVPLPVPSKETHSNSPLSAAVSSDNTFVVASEGGGTLSASTPDLPLAKDKQFANLMAIDGELDKSKNKSVKPRKGVNQLNETAPMNSEPINSNVTQKPDSVINASHTLITKLIATQNNNKTLAVSEPTSTTKVPKKPLHLSYEALVNADTNILNDEAKIPESNPSSKTLPASKNQIPSPNDDTIVKVYPSKANSHPEMIMPIVITILVVPMFVIVGYMALRRGQEAWKNRHYKRMDFLLDGMYND